MATETILVSVPGVDGQAAFTREEAFRIGMKLLEFATDRPEFQDTLNDIFQTNSVDPVTEIK